MEKNPFFIISLPRSRTAWLANLLTYGDYSFCHHEATRYCQTLEELNDLMDGDEWHQGNSDSCLVTWGVDNILKMWPSARFVFIYRDSVECNRSYKAAFPEIVSRCPNTERVLIELMLQMKELRNKLEPERVLAVSYPQLEQTKYIREIWEFCLPGLPFPVQRVNMLQQMRVDTIFQKMMQNVHPKLQKQFQKLKRKQSVLP
ncbi:MAG TPA: sulfotransferase [Verrucomicrobiae bacterium]|nr:sulfotransferase [Verrucomicrobiae bacterium]